MPMSSASQADQFKLTCDVYSTVGLLVSFFLNITTTHHAAIDLFFIRLLKASLCCQTGICRYCLSAGKRYRISVTVMSVA